MATGGTKKVDKCLVCNENVTKKDMAVACDICLKWCHTKCCGIDAATYENMKSLKTLRWYCESCDAKMLKLISDVARLAERQDKLEDEFGKVNDNVNKLRQEVDQNLVKQSENFKSAIDANKNEIAQIRQEVDKLQKFDLARQVEELTTTFLKDEFSQMREEIDKLEKQDVPKQVEQLTTAFVRDGQWTDVVKKELVAGLQGVKEDVEEKMEIERRKKNLILFGVPESDTGHDDDIVSDIITQALKLDCSRHIETIARIGKFSHEKPRPIKLVIKTIEGRKEILIRAKMLRELDSYKGIFVAPDLTRRQQDYDKDLRSNLKRIRDEGEPEAVIRSGKIIKKNENGKTIAVLYPVSQ